MSKIISEITILSFEYDGENPSWTMHAFNEKQELFNKLLTYYCSIGVDSYNLFENGDLLWRLNGKWFSSEEIERALKLKSFS